MAENGRNAKITVIGIRPEAIFLNKHNIITHLAHWKHQDEWFRQDSIAVPYKELWHGNRFRELSYFFDEYNEYLLPSLCSICNSVFSPDLIDELCNFNPQQGQIVHAKCQECYEDNVITVQLTKGHSLNQVFIFHEDAFNAFFKRSKKVAAIQISDGCVEKILRGETKRTFSFCPSSNLPEGIVHKFDAFLEPLIEEIKHYYIQGFDVNIEDPIVVNGYRIPCGIYKIRCLGAADLKAHQEMVLYAGGKTCHVNSAFLVILKI